MNIYEKKMQIMKELLFELDDICREHELQYSIVGESGQMIYKSGHFPEQFDALSVAMTGGDIARFEHIINSRNDSHRQVETIRNNPRSRFLANRYCNCDTTLINIKSFGGHINYGIFIELLEIEKIAPNNKRGKCLKYAKKVWKGSQKHWSACTAKQKAASVPLKAGIAIVGRQRVGNMLYKQHEKLCGIDRWDQIASYKNIAVGRTRIRNSGLEAMEESGDERKSRSSWDIQDVYTQGHRIKFASVFLERNPQATQSHDTVVKNEILDPYISFREVLSSDIAADILEAQKERNAYIRIITKAKRPATATQKAWDTYLMTRDVVALRDMYSEEECKKVAAAIENRDLETFANGIAPYIRISGKWRQKKVPFIQNQDVVELIRGAIPVLYRDQPEEAKRLKMLIGDLHINQEERKGLSL